MDVLTYHISRLPIGRFCHEVAVAPWNQKLGLLEEKAGLFFKELNVGRLHAVVETLYSGCGLCTWQPTAESDHGSDSLAADETNVLVNNSHVAPQAVFALIFDHQVTHMTMWQRAANHNELQCKAAHAV